MRHRRNTERFAERWVKAGRGSGTARQYKPWLVIQDVPSSGVVSRVSSWKAGGRTVHVLSRLELSYFYVLEWYPAVIDIREQFPLLPVADAVRVATTLGVRYPTIGGERIVMTSDFRVTVRTKTGVHDEVRAVKPWDMLANGRVVEKLQIERHFWENQGIPFAVVTEREIPTILTQNVEYVHPYWDAQELGVDSGTLRAMSSVLTDLIVVGDLPPIRAAHECDVSFAAATGTALNVVKHLIARRKIAVDMSQPLRLDKPLPSLGSEAAM